PTFRTTLSPTRSCPYRTLRSFPTRRSSDLQLRVRAAAVQPRERLRQVARSRAQEPLPQPAAAERRRPGEDLAQDGPQAEHVAGRDRKSTRLNSSHVAISYAVFCLKKKNRGH